MKGALTMSNTVDRVMQVKLLHVTKNNGVDWRDRVPMIRYGSWLQRACARCTMDNMEETVEP